MLNSSLKLDEGRPKPDDTKTGKYKQCRTLCLVSSLHCLYNFRGERMHKRFKIIDIQEIYKEIKKAKPTFRFLDTISNLLSTLLIFRQAKLTENDKLQLEAIAILIIISLNSIDDLPYMNNSIMLSDKNNQYDIFETKVAEAISRLIKNELEEVNNFATYELIEIITRSFSCLDELDADAIKLIKNYIENNK